MKTSRCAIAAIAFAAGCLVPSGVFAATLLVKPGGTAPYYSTIQSAVSAAQDGDTIECEEGVYDTGSHSSANTSWAVRRAYCSGKSNLTIIGAGCGRSVVKGVVAATSSGTGTGAIGGFHFKNCVGLKISGFAFVDCGTTGTDSNINRSQGAAILVEGGDCVVEDCSFEHCRAAQGGAVAGFCAAADLTNGGTDTLSLARCLFSDCSTAAGGTGAIAWNARFCYCVFTRFYNLNIAPIRACTLFNCTFVNTVNHHYLENSVAYNTVFANDTFRLGNGASDTLYNCVATAPAADVTVTAGDEANLYGQNDIYFYNFVAGDYRPVEGSALVGRANADYIRLIPEACRAKDFCGNTVDLSGDVNVGAAASADSVARPTARYVRFLPAAGDTQIVINGVTNRFNTTQFGDYYINMYVFGEYPSMNRVRILSSAIDWGLIASGADTTTRYPEKDGDYVFMPPPMSSSSSSSLRLVHKTATTNLLVDAASSAVAPDGTVGNEFPTVQAAVDAAPAGAYSIITVAAGTYGTGGAKLTETDVKSRVAVSGKNLRIIGAGADSTFLVGEPDGNAQEGEYGCGGNAVRCFATDSSGQLAGFTLTGGHTAFGSANDACNGAGALLANAAFTVTDCIISNNVSSRTTMLGKDVDNRLVLSRCRIEGNTSIYTPMWATEIASASSLWANNIITTLSTSSRDIPLWGGAWNNDSHGWIFDSTFYVPGCEDSSGTVTFQGYVGGTDRTTSHCRNCLILGSGTARNITCHGTVVDTFIPGSTRTTYSVNLDGGVSGYKILGFNDVANGDFRLRGTSEGATNAVWRADDGDSGAYIYTTASLDGVWPDFSGATLQPSGCYRRPVARVTTGNFIDPSDAWVGPGDSLELTIDPKVPVQYVTVDGVRQEQPGGLYSFTYTYPLDAALRTVSVEVVKDTDWYVDAVNGSDEGHGTQSAPLAKLSDACERAVSNDVVHVAPGTYAEGVMAAGKTFWTASPGNVKARVTVKSGVTVEASNPAVETAIVGALDPDGDSRGRGSKAVRCAVVHSGGVLRGFTLRDGRTTASSYNDDGLGAGVLGDTDGLVEDCVITNCWAYLSAGNGYGTFNRCKFVGCGSDTKWSVGYCGRYTNCYFNHNYGTSSLMAPYVIDSCTIGADHRNQYGDGIDVILSSGATEIRNLLFLSVNGKISVSVNTTFKGCFLKQSKVYAYNNGAWTWTFDEACRDLSSSALPVDDDGHPVFGSNPAIDGGETSAYDVATMGDRDCDGNPRIMNGNKIDVGCFEYDWRGKFAQKLGRRVTVSTVGPGVELLDTGVKVPANETMALQVATQPDRPFFFAAKVVGGELSVSRDGESFAVLTNDKLQTFRGGAQSPTAFEFVQGDNGYSILSDFRLNVGMLFRVH